MKCRQTYEIEDPTAKINTDGTGRALRRHSCQQQTQRHFHRSVPDRRRDFVLNRSKVTGAHNEWWRKIPFHPYFTLIKASGQSRGNYRLRSSNHSVFCWLMCLRKIRMLETMKRRNG